MSETTTERKPCPSCGNEGVENGVATEMCTNGDCRVIEFYNPSNRGATLFLSA